MQITLISQRRDDRLHLSRTGDVLTINGVAYDFGPLPEGALLPREAVDCGWLASDVERAGGVLRLALIVPHGAEAPSETLHPAPRALAADGPVALPAYETPREIEESADDTD